MTKLTSMSGEQFSAALKNQGVSREHLAFTCPMCGTVQSARDLIRAGAGPDFHAVSNHLGISCIGRFTGAAAPRSSPDGQPCNWTLNGVRQMHTFEVNENGLLSPFFPPATHAEAQAHKRQSDLLDADIPKKPYGFEEFFRDAKAMNLTADMLIPQLAARPEFADCLPGAAPPHDDQPVKGTP